VAEFVRKAGQLPVMLEQDTHALTSHNTRDSGSQEADSYSADDPAHVSTDHIDLSSDTTHAKTTQ